MMLPPTQKQELRWSLVVFGCCCLLFLARGKKAEVTPDLGGNGLFLVHLPQHFSSDFFFFRKASTTLQGGFHAQNRKEGKLRMVPVLESCTPAPSVWNTAPTGRRTQLGTPSAIWTPASKEDCANTQGHLGTPSLMNPIIDKCCLTHFINTKRKTEPCISIRLKDMSVIYEQ